MNETLRLIGAITPPGQEGWREAPGWWFKSNWYRIDQGFFWDLIHHPFSFVAVAPPGPAG